MKGMLSPGAEPAAGSERSRKEARAGGGGGNREAAPTVSIIVPVYNAEKTIERCIQSILNQEYKDFELLLLDDGSTDDSGRICEAYGAKDGRIRVLHKENTGVSDTRNRGISMARGEYLQFLDSDDWIAPEATRFFLQAARENDCDMVIADFYRVIGERVSQKGSIEEEGVMTRMDYAVKMMQRPADFYYGVLWNKFYKRSIIEKYGLRMDDSVSWCEDFMFNLEYVRHTDKIYALKLPVYYYVKTKGSLVSQGTSVKKTIQMKRTVFACYNDFYKDVFDDMDYEKRKGQVYRFLFDAASDGSVSPLNIPGNYKLGNERTRVSEGVLEGEGTFFDIYRERKLQERLFDIVALRNDLTTVDVKLLYYLDQPHENCTLKEMANVLNISRREFSQSVQRLLAKEMIAVSEKDKGKVKSGSKNESKSGFPGEPKGEEKEKQSDRQKANEKEYVVTREAENIMSELLFVLCDFEHMQYEGFSPEEIALYEKLNEKRKRNIQGALRA